MRENLRRLLFGLAVGAALTGPTAAAAEQLVMPFSCRVAGGTVQLAPSAPQAYQIYGRAQHKQLTTCSPFDPRKCHTWAVHRFDLDCGGARTSWQSVVAALAPIIAESLPAGDTGDGAAYGPPPRAYRPGPAISFPAGFAPNPMKVARFEQSQETAQETAAVPPPPKKPAEPPEVAENAPDTAPAAPADAAKKTATNKPATKTAAAAPKAAEPQRPPLKIEVEPASSEVTGSLPNSASSTLWRDAGTVFTVTLALLFALSATLLLGRRRDEVVPYALALLPQRRTLPARTSHLARESAAPPRQDTSATRLRLWDEDWLPSTQSEALDVLGVDPAASIDMMKTTVTRLRRALHPDYALDEEDRALRERRLKQINVAWEIISGKRHALWLAGKTGPSAPAPAE